MGLFDGIVIVSDIDGTFLGKNSRLVPENMEKLDYFKKNGGGFTLATGREHFLVDRDIPQVKEICNWPMIACNGAYLYDWQSGKKISEAYLQDEALTDVLREVEAMCPGSGFRMTMADDCYYVERPYKYSLWMERVCPERRRIMPLDEMPRGCWYKAVFDGPEEEIECAYQRLLQLDERFVCVRACPTIVEVQPVNGTKGAMLKTARSIMKAETVYAIGDYENDYDMLISSDRCAAPANAMDKIKAIPGIIPVCHHDQGAIADLIDHIEKELSK